MGSAWSSPSWLLVAFLGPVKLAVAEDLSLLPLSREASDEGTVWLFLQTLSGKGHMDGEARASLLFLLVWLRFHPALGAGNGRPCGLDQHSQQQLEPRGSWAGAGGWRASV